MCALCGMQPSRRNKCLYFRLHFAETSKCVHFVDVISSLLQHTSHPIQITRIWADSCIKQVEGMVVRLCRQAMNHRSGHYFNICKLETTEQFEGEITVPVGVSKICEHYMTGYFSLFIFWWDIGTAVFEPDMLGKKHNLFRTLTKWSLCLT